MIQLPYNPSRHTAKCTRIWRTPNCVHDAQKASGYGSTGPRNNSNQSRVNPSKPIMSSPNTQTSLYVPKAIASKDPTIPSVPPKSP